VKREAGQGWEGEEVPNKKRRRRQSTKQYRWGPSDIKEDI
jgi:hypothetical protein